MIARAYAAPDCVDSVEEETHNRWFWLDFVSIIGGNVVFTLALLMMNLLPTLLTIVLVSAGILLAWGSGRRIDSRDPAIATSRGEWSIASVGALLLGIVLLAVICQTPNADFVHWSINPFGLPVAWMLLCNSCLRLMAGLRAYRDKQASLMEGAPPAPVVAHKEPPKNTGLRW